jgi:hypothetical protein
MALGVVPDPVALPGTVRHHVGTPPGLKWSFDLHQSANDEDETYLEHPVRRAYRAGKTYRFTMNVGVFGPSAGGPESPFGAVRHQDGIDLCVPMFSDGAGNFGDSLVTRARTTVTADGRKIVDEETGPCGGLADLPDAAATYTVSADVSRSAKVSAATTRVTADWTFTSARPTGDEEVWLPLSTVRFHPRLSLASTAKAGRSLTVPLTVEGAAAGRGLRTLRVWVSYDGGEWWRGTAVRTDANGGKSITLKHPERAKSVSLKVRLSDTSGNTTHQVLHRAYNLVR